MEKAGFDSNRAISGGFGKVHIDGVLIMEATGGTAKVENQYETVPMCGDLAEHQKYTGYKGTGSLEMTKIFSRGARLLSDAMKTGNMPSFTITLSLEDPAAFGFEKIVLYGCKFNDLTLMEFKSSTKVLSEILNFTFTDWDYIDMIEVQ